MAIVDRYYRFVGYNVQQPISAVTMGQLSLGTGSLPTPLNLWMKVQVDTSIESDMGTIDYYMNERGYEYLASAPTDSVSVVRQLKSARLSANSSSISVSSGWVDVSGLSVSFSTTGGTNAHTIASCVAASIVAGGEIRVLVNGGSFTDEVVQTVAFDANSQGQASFSVPFAIPTTGSPTNYTFKVQARALGLLASVTVAAKSALTVLEFS